MGFLAHLLFNFIHKNQHSKDRRKANYIFYKIIDYRPKQKAYVLQCINKKAVFYSPLIDIISDIDILYGLHPIQACYIGMVYSKYSSKINSRPVTQNNVRNLNQYETYRYGKYSVCSEDRKRNIYFIDHDTHEKFLMDPSDLAVIENLIQEFDAAHAFHIGLLAGYKLSKPFLNPTPKYKGAKYQRLHIVQNK